jgi:nicotinamide-nucleotide amidase
MSGARRISADLAAMAKKVLALASERDLGFVTAESCTSGLLANALSEAPGAAELLHGGFVTYTKANKTAALGVPADLLRTRGAVCPEVAIAMAEGALARSPADVAIAITGVAGPDEDEDGNPVGLVFIAVARKSLPSVVLERRYGDLGRDAVRERAMIDALREVERLLGADGR